MLEPGSRAQYRVYSNKPNNPGLQIRTEHTSAGVPAEMHQNDIIGILSRKTPCHTQYQYSQTVEPTVGSTSLLGAGKQLNQGSLESIGTLQGSS